MSDELAIHAIGIDKAFGQTKALVDASVEVAPGELVALLGPSGSGKTTLLRVVAGFEVPDRGSVDIAGRRVAGPGAWVEPERRRVGMVFQDGALFPHLTVARNVAFGGPAQGRVKACLELVGLPHRADAYPHELSGGERQRIALARALAIDPEVVLLDEPFAALDAGLRVALRAEVVSILRETGASALLVTHDQEEALSLADRVVVMRGGRVEQATTPEEAYARPANRWVAQFLGEADILEATADSAGVRCALGPVPAGAPSGPNGETTLGVRGPVEVVVRPEAVAVAAAASPQAPAGAVSGTVIDRSYFGHDQLLELELADGIRVRSRLPGTARWAPGDAVLAWLNAPVAVLSPPADDNANPNDNANG